MPRSRTAACWPCPCEPRTWTAACWPCPSVPHHGQLHAVTPCWAAARSTAASARSPLSSPALELGRHTPNTYGPAGWHAAPPPARVEALAVRVRGSITRRTRPHWPPPAPRPRCPARRRSPAQPCIGTSFRVLVAGLPRRPCIRECKMKRESTH